MATEDSFGRERQSFQRAVLSDGFLRVAGAGGMKTTALSQVWANHRLIPFDKTNQETTHRLWISFQRPSRLSRRRALCAVRAALRAPTTRSRAGSCPAIRRKDSRTWRFTRLRATELPTAFLPIDRPRRGYPSVLGAALTEKKLSMARTRCV